MFAYLSDNKKGRIPCVGILPFAFCTESSLLEVELQRQLHTAVAAAELRGIQELQ